MLLKPCQKYLLTRNELLLRVMSQTISEDIFSAYSVGRKNLTRQRARDELVNAISSLLFQEFFGWRLSRNHRSDYIMSSRGGENEVTSRFYTKRNESLLSGKAREYTHFTVHPFLHLFRLFSNFLILFSWQI